MESEEWVVVTNGKKFRLRHMHTGEWYTEIKYEPFMGNPYGGLKEWDTLEEASEVAKNKTWRPV